MCWLCGWAIGEAVILWILVKGAVALLTGRPPDPGRDPLELGPAVTVGGLLILWLAFWTLGGNAALGSLLQLGWAEDRDRQGDEQPFDATPPGDVSEGECAAILKSITVDD